MGLRDRWSAMPLNVRALFASGGIILAAMVAMTVTGWDKADPFKVSIIDVIPNERSEEEDANPEPAIAVNPRNTEEIAITAFQLAQRWNCDPTTPSTCGPCDADSSGVVATADGGATWHLRCTFPLGDRGATGPLTRKHYDALDASVGYSGSGLLYGSYLQLVSGRTNLRVISSKNVTDGVDMSPTILTTDAYDLNSDMPFLATWSKTGTDVAVVGLKQEVFDTNAECWTGVVWWWKQGTQHGPECATSLRNADGPTETVRLAIHPTGRTYGILYLRHLNGLERPSLILTAGELDGASPSATQSLKETSGVILGTGCPAPDGQVGVRIACNVQVKKDPMPFDLGGQRRHYFTLSVAVDPRDEDRVVVAYLETGTAALATVHVMESRDGGKTGFTRLRSLDNVVNPALAIQSSGRIGLLYQEYVPATGGSGQWKTAIDVSSVSAASWTRYELADTPVILPAMTEPYIGDYVRLQAVGEHFYGVFSAHNDPKFHPTARYLRDLVPVGVGGRKLPDGVTASVDPFFFRLKRQPLPVQVWAAMVLSTSGAFDWLKKLLSRRLAPPPVPTPVPSKS
jgi:hypothetical protein